MKRIFYFRKYEKGQVIIIVALGLVALIAMAALIVDGAIIMSHRRTAQAAADAAALAGAEYLCPHVYNKGAAEAEARNYVALNNAVVVDPVSFPEENTIHVEASVESSSFFARIFNESVLSANAVAEASCTPLSTGVATMPVVFPCKDLDPNDGEVNCSLEYYDDDLTEKQNMEAGNYSLLHWSDAQNPLCDDPDLSIYCENVVAMGDKGWVALDINKTKQDMGDWISGAVIPPEIRIGFWLASFPGVSNNWFHNVLKPYEGQLFLIPIYNAECGKTMPSDICPSLFIAGFDDESLTVGYQKPCYRIAGFGLFRMTCVQTQKEHDCDYRKILIDEGFDELDGNSSVKTVEGYFIEGTYPTGGGDGGDAGVYTVQLRR